MRILFASFVSATSASVLGCFLSLGSLPGFRTSRSTCSKLVCAPPLGGEARLDADPGVLVCAGDSAVIDSNDGSTVECAPPLRGEAVCAGDSAVIDSNDGSTVECAPPLRGEARLDVNLGVRVSAGDSAVIDLNAGSDSRTS